MDLKDLRYFRAVAESGSFSKAAAHIRVAQPALSRHMSRLEHSLGVELLRRTSKGVILTPAGAELLKRTAALERDLDLTRRAVSDYAREVTGILHVAVQFPASILMIPALISAYRAKYPHVAIHVVDGVSRSITDGLLREELDIAIVDTPSHDHVDLTVTPLWVENLRLVGPASAEKSELFQKPAVTIAELAELPIIMPSPNHALRHLVEVAFGKHHLRFCPVFEADGALMIMELVKAGQGYTLIPDCVSYPMLAANEVVATDISPPILRTVSVVTRSVLRNEKTVTPFIELVRSMVPSIAASDRYGHAVPYSTEERRFGIGGY